VIFAPGFFPGGDYLGLFWAGRRFAAGQVASDGSARLSGLPEGLATFWVARAPQPVPDLGFERYGMTGTGGSWGNCYGFSGRFVALSAFEQHSGFADAHVCAWDGSQWTSVWSTGYWYESLRGLVDDGAQVLFVDYSPNIGYKVLAYVPGSGVSEVARPNSDIERLFRGGDGCIYLWLSGFWNWMRKGVWRLDGSSLAQVAAPLSGARQHAVAPSGEVFGVQYVSPSYYVVRWSGSAWVPASCPFDGGSSEVTLSAGPRALWALSDGRVCRMESGVWSQPELPCGMPAQGLYPMGDGSCWAVVNNAGSLQLAQWAQKTGWVLGPLVPQGVQWILGDDPEGNLWVGGPGPAPVPVYELPVGLMR
jgi:hypothetical protein